MIDKIKRGIIQLEILIDNPEKFLNLLWDSEIEIADIKRVSITTIIISINYIDYDEVVSLVEKSKGKIKILSKKGKIFKIKKISKKKSLIVGSIIFLAIVYYLSTYVWAIDISTVKNVSPYEIRQNLKQLGITAGMNKKDIDVYELENKISKMNNNILWVRIRIEGSTLKVIVKEKINPPEIRQEDNYDDCIAKMDGEIKRIFVTSGTAVVNPGDMVKEGDILIKGLQGKEGGEYKVKGEGVAIANTFYERMMEVQISGKELVKTGEKDSDIYITINGAKIYLKKAINNFKYYDKIESNSSFIHNVDYYEKKEMKININREDAISKASDSLEKSLIRNLNNDAVIVDKKIEVEEIDNNRIRVKVIFVVEQNIILES